MAYNLNRIYSGLFIILSVILSYIFEADLILLLTLFIFITYEVIKNRLFNNNFSSLLIFIFFIIYFTGIFSTSSLLILIIILFMIIIWIMCNINTTIIHWHFTIINRIINIIFDTFS